MFCLSSNSHNMQKHNDPKAGCNHLTPSYKPNKAIKSTKLKQIMLTIINPYSWFTVYFVQVINHMAHYMIYKGTKCAYSIYVLKTTKILVSIKNKNMAKN